MSKIFRIKINWFTSLGMILFSLGSFAQNYSDETIRFDRNRVRALLKGYGIPDQDLNRELIRAREIFISSYVLEKEYQDKVFSETRSKQKLESSSNKSGLNSTLALASITDIPQAEKDFLFALYNSTNGNDWTNKKGWDFNTPVTSWNNSTSTGWFGITLSADNHIKDIFLSNNNLVGLLPSNIGDLSGLQSLYLNANKISGSIPSSYANLPNLKNLFLNNNQLTGSLPFESPNLPKIEQIYLHSNQLTGSIPSGIGNLPQLKNLELLFNQLSGTIPTSIGNLGNLTSFRITVNQITGAIPQEIGNAVKLVVIDLSNNKLTGAIPKLERLQDLQGFTIYNNEIKGPISYEMSLLPKLNSFSISQNNFYFADFVNEYDTYKYRAGGNFLYNTQKPTDTQKTINATAGETVTLTMFEDNRTVPTDTFQWYHKGTLIPNATSRSYTISNVLALNSGNYHCIAKNTKITDLTLTRNTIQLNVPCSLALSSATGTDSQTTCLSTAINPITYATTGVTAINVTVSGLPSGLSGIWAANVVTISGTPMVSGTFNYSVNLNGPCGIISKTGIVIITANKTVSAASNTPSLCINSALTITHTTVRATGIGTPVGLPSGVTSAWASNIITISGTPTVSGTFNYSIPVTGGCGAVNATGTIIVSPAKTVSAASGSPTLCANTALTVITHTTVGATGIGTPVGLPSGVTAAWALNMVTISGTPTVSGTFNYIIPIAGGCGALLATGTIIVTPAKTVSFASGIPIVCANTALTITHTTVGATGIGTPLGLPSGIAADWASNIIAITGTPTVSGIFNYSIPLAGVCGEVNATGTIIVSPAQTVSAASGSPTLCINTALAAITHTTSGALGIETPVGLPSGVTAAWASNIITINGTPTVSGTFNYIIPLTGCRAANAVGTIIVTPATTVALSSEVGTDMQTKCLETAVTQIIYTTTGITGATVTGLPTGVSGNWAANMLTISGTPTTSGTFNYTVTLTGGCEVVTKTGSIIVIPINSITLSSEIGTDNQSKNDNVAITPITYVTSGALNASITGLPAGVTGSFSNNIITVTGTPTNSGTFNYSINLAGGCGTITATGKITSLCKPITGLIKIEKTHGTSYSFQFSNPRSTSALACEEVVFPIKLYTRTVTLDINTQLYLNESLTIPVANGDLWYQYQENATSYKIDNTGKITETYSCSTSVCDKRYLTDVTITAPQGSVIDFSYFLTNGTQVTDRFTASSNGGEQIHTFPVLNCISESAWGVDGDTSTVTPNWNDNIECCVVIRTGYEFRFSNPGRTSSSLACAQTSFTNKFYAATSTLGIGTQLYTSASLTTPVGSGNLWYQLGIDGISYRIDNTGKVAEIIPCGEEPPVQTYLFRAVHPEGHSGSDYVTYIDADGAQQKYTFPRSPDSNPAPCEQIEARSIILEIGVVPCTE